MSIEGWVDSCILHCTRYDPAFQFLESTGLKSDNKLCHSLNYDIHRKIKGRVVCVLFELVCARDGTGCFRLRRTPSDACPLPTSTMWWRKTKGGTLSRFLELQFTEVIGARDNSPYRISWNSSQGMTVHLIGGVLTPCRGRAFSRSMYLLTYCQEHATIQLMFFSIRFPKDLPIPYHVVVLGPGTLSRYIYYCTCHYLLVGARFSTRRSSFDGHSASVW